MKYIKETLQYIKIHFFSLIIYSMLPGLILAFVANPISMYKFLVTDYIKKDSISLKDMFANMLDISNWKNVLIFILALVAIICFLSAIGGIIERHFRLGEFSHKYIVKDINAYFITLISHFILFIVLLEIYGVISIMFAYFWRVIIVDNIIASLSLTFITLIIFTILLLYVYAKLLLMIPHTIITRANTKRALIEVNRRLNWKTIWNIIVAIVLPAVPIYIVYFLLGIFIKNPGTYKYVSIPIGFVVYSIAIIYYVVLIFITYFDVFSMDREDKSSKWGGLK